MQTTPALVLAGYGLNCDYETQYALTLAGADARRVHINDLINGAVRLSDFRILVFDGGFSWGDDHGAGVIEAVRIRTNLGDQILQFVADGNLIIGICNGFQTLVNMGLLPGFDNDYTARSVALTYNDCGNFRDDWVHLAVTSDTPCIFTSGLDSMELPIRHGEGKFYAEPRTVDRLTGSGQVVLRYAMPDGAPAEGRFPENPNGSLQDIAGICDPTGRIFGLMPHPEAYNHPTNHPDWTRTREHRKRLNEPPPAGNTPGIRIFENAVSYCRQ
jgi:phosphoribosylformylglycinamidine synthase subunit PurQ / glutaminase